MGRIRVGSGFDYEGFTISIAFVIVGMEQIHTNSSKQGVSHPTGRANVSVVLGVLDGIYLVSSNSI